jgi:hypothetical protein
MTESDWNKVMNGTSDREVLVNGEYTKVRYIVADAISVQAKAARAAGRMDKAGVLKTIATKIHGGYMPSKSTVTKVAKELAAVKKRIVDGKAFQDA